MLIRLGLKELARSMKALRVVVLILFVGFIGPLAASSLRTSVSVYLQERSRQILSADLAVTSTRPFKEEEKKQIRDTLKPTRSAFETEFVTMGRGRDVATLVEVKGVDENYPVFGSFEISGQPGTRSALELNKEKIAWVFPEVLAQLNLKVGDSLTLGRTQFRIAGELSDGPGMSRAGMGVAPRVYIGLKFVEETGLTQFGSQVNHRFYFELPKNLSSEVAAVRIKEALPDPDIYLRTPDDSIQGLERFFRFFNLYLIVITLIVFALSWVSAFYILQIYLQDRLRNAAILMTVGASRLFVAVLYAIQILGVMALSLAAAWIAVEILVAIVPSALGNLLPKGFDLRVRSVDVLTSAGVATASALAFSLPLFVKVSTLRLQALLSEDSLAVTHGRPLERLLSYGPLVVIFLALSTWLMGSIDFALRFLGGVTVAVIGGLFIGRLFFKAVFGAFKSTPGFARLVATNLARGRFGTNLCFLALVLVALVLNLVPHLLKSVSEEIQPLQGKEVPSLFLFNIPESAVEPLQKFTAERNAELRYLSPMILARLMKVNGKETQDDRFQRFPVRLSYRSKPIPSETVIEGREFSGSFDASSGDIPGVSVEARFAERNGFKLGDTLEFDVQGVPVEGKIANLRTVKWTEFNPNFFMLFQPGVLDDAPKTYLANVMISGDKVKYQYELIKEFPDLSVIDVGRTVARVLEVATSIIGPVNYAAWLAVTMSFLILAAVIFHNLKLRHPEIDVQKMMGAEAPLIRRLIVGEYAVSALMASLIGAGAAIGLCFVVTQVIFDIPARISWSALGLSFVVTVGLTSLIARQSAQNVLMLRGASRKM